MSSKKKSTGTPSKAKGTSKKSTDTTTTTTTTEAPMTATTATDTDTDNVVPIKDETPRHEWGGKHAECTECGTTALKHYSGGQCTRCYTEKRNAKLGLGKYNPETNARRLERLTAKADKLQAQLSEVRAQMKELEKKSA